MHNDVSEYHKPNAKFWEDLDKQNQVLGKICAVYNLLGFNLPDSSGQGGDITVDTRNLKYGEDNQEKFDYPYAITIRVF